MSFIINETTEEKWFDYSSDESYLLVFIDDDKYQSFLDKKGKLLKGDDMLDAMIKDWKGIFKKEGEEIKPLECSKENKTLLMNKAADRFSFILTTCRNYNKFVDLEKYQKN